MGNTHTETFTGISDFDLAKTLGCGQHFRFRRIGEDKFATIKRSTLYIVRQNKEANTLEITCDESERASNCFETLGIDEDYTPVTQFTEKFPQLAPMIEKSWGIKIMHQDPWEMLVSFIISQRNSIKKIQDTIERLCGATTSPMVMGTMRYYPFPTPEELLKAYTDGKLETVGLGYRLPYIGSVAEETVRGNFNIYSLESTKVSYDTALTALMELYGVGPKVANCVALFGLGHTSAFPIDTWVQAAIDKFFDGNLDATIFGEYAGFIQQCIFNYTRNEQ